MSEAISASKKIRWTQSIVRVLKKESTVCAKFLWVLRANSWFLPRALFYLYYRYYCRWEKKRRENNNNNKTVFRRAGKWLAGWLLINTNFTSFVATRDQRNIRSLSTEYYSYYPSLISSVHSGRKSSFLYTQHIINIWGSFCILRTLPDELPPTSTLYPLCVAATL